MTTPRVRAARITVPEDIRSRSGLGRIDYESAFSVAVDPADRRSPEQWARATYESPPALQRLFVRCGWKALGAQLGPFPSDERRRHGDVRRSRPAAGGELPSR